MSDIRLSAREQQCLRLLADAADHPEQCILFYKHITIQTGLELHQARRAVRSLARKGLAEHKVAWDCDEGAVMGSGYMATDAGVSLSKSFLHEDNAGAAK